MLNSLWQKGPKIRNEGTKFGLTVSADGAEKKLSREGNEQRRNWKTIRTWGVQFLFWVVSVHLV